MLEFNAAGLLIPPSIINSTIEEFKQYFAIDSPENIRKNLFNNYLEYNQELKEVCGITDLKQWIDGSFVTKKARPVDLDFVNFISFEIAEINEIALKKFTYPESLINYGLDAYIVVVYPENHKSHFAYRANSSYWMDQFDKTKPKGERKGIPKGFLEIIV
jgi:hypothetical protein